jgi:hypothetical protein
MRLIWRSNWMSREFDGRAAARCRCPTPRGHSDGWWFNDGYLSEATDPMTATQNR